MNVWLEKICGWKFFCVHKLLCQYKRADFEKSPSQWLSIKQCIHYNLKFKLTQRACIVESLRFCVVRYIPRSAWPHFHQLWSSLALFLLFLRIYKLLGTGSVLPSISYATRNICNRIVGKSWTVPVLLSASYQGFVQVRRPHIMDFNCYWEVRQLFNIRVFSFCFQYSVLLLLKRLLIFTCSDFLYTQGR